MSHKLWPRQGDWNNLPWLGIPVLQEPSTPPLGFSGWLMPSIKIGSAGARHLEQLHPSSYTHPSEAGHRAGHSPTGSTQNPLADSLATLGLAQRGERLLTVPLRGRCCYHLHFSSGETKAQKG